MRTQDYDCLESFISVARLVYDRDVLLMGGSYEADKYTGFKDKFVVQLNHHLFRRHTQPCDWLIARQGSGMVAETYLSKLPEYHRQQIKILSTQINQAERFEEWNSFDKVLFPFHEIGHSSPNPYHPSLEWCNAFWNELGTNPLIGILATKMILMFPIRSLTLIGFDFYTSNQNKRINRRDVHDLTVQRAWLKNTYNTDFRLILNKTTLEELQSDPNNRGRIETYSSRE